MAEEAIFTGVIADSSEVFRLTNELRFRAVKWGDGKRSILEQKWLGNDGSVKWRVVPSLKDDEA